jgi:uncharacterized iron-regulated membrane protein
MSTKPTFRQSMAPLHTWAGVVIGSLLFVIFWMGTLSVFDREIDRWMMPGTRLTASALEQPVKLDGQVTTSISWLTEGATQWFIRLPNERVPAIELRWRDVFTQANERRFLHPQTGAVLSQTDSLGASGFIFPFHYSLHIKWQDVGKWLVGLAGMSMLVLVVSGVVIHRRIFADFFLFRPRQKLPRASLDLHNLTGVLAMPFHFGVALSGLMIFFVIYWPSGYDAAYPQAKDARQAFSAEGQGQYRRAKAKSPATQPLASLDAMRVQAELLWAQAGQTGQANFIRVWHPGNANSYVELRRSYNDSITMNLDQLYLDASTGQVLQRFEAEPVMTVQRFISGLHFIQFDHWLLRWLYFVAGLSGCLMIASGFVFWLESRRASHAKKGLAPGGLSGLRVVQALTVFSVPGIAVATLAFLIGNRLLPHSAALGGYDRADLEVWAFYLVWLATLAHAAWRGQTAWREQAWAVVVLSTLAVLLNAVTTGHHLGYALPAGLVAVAGVDLMLLLLAGLAGGIAWHLSRKVPVLASDAPQDVLTSAAAGPSHA